MNLNGKVGVGVMRGRHKEREIDAYTEACVMLYGGRSPVVLLRKRSVKVTWTQPRPSRLD